MNPVVESLPILVLYPHSRCNCRCVMCDIWKTDTIQEISAEELEQHVADMERVHVQWVVFSGGEPLMHSDLFRLCRILRERNIRTTILSTGLLLERHARQIVANADDVIVSLDGPPAIHDQIRRIPRAFDIMQRGIDALLLLKPDFPVCARSTVQRLNHAHLRETVETARHMGVRSISFLAADLTSSAFNRPQPWNENRQGDIGLTSEEIDTLEAEIDALPDPGGFVVETREKLRRIAAHFRAHLGQTEPVAPVCNAPWVSAVIESDGTVRPCFFQPPIGTIRGNGSLLHVINGLQAQAFRSSLNVATNAICCRCVCSLNWKS
ncbi:MAG TPA: radical SAM/SPASM domain-containing protein [Bryobacteraceae bacterium]|nr:radical SAM/SPASM domain-containing protein [Bryobacteraceae bacterium]